MVLLVEIILVGKWYFTGGRNGAPGRNGTGGGNSTVLVREMVPYWWWKCYWSGS